MHHAASSLVTLLGALFPLVTAHGAVTSYVIDSVTYPGYEGYSPQYGPDTIEREWTSYNPIMTPETPDITCNGGTSADLTAQISPGSTVTAKWKQWTHRQGPVTVWMYACPTSTIEACTGQEGANWFKIDEMGLTVEPSLLSSDNWGTSIVVDELEWTSTIPEGLKSGLYLLRHELLALHQANTPQFYPECAQVEVVDGGGSFPTGEYLTAIPGAGYALADDPSVDVNVYASSEPTTFKVHGPPVWNP
ncbi:glycoside hydrolase family 61 protein [Zalerion maritima]|uniref:lytic cellulose monooxygenase (C4-dehydrogenating) n=1 Tax=Zalerion maritima TaxID=339359 RepID=A0AAD5RLR6_9PEZI|nr:glycoside hydrolase family 61 protein [Zalerion maritima]